MSVCQLDSGTYEIEIQPEVGTIGYMWSVMEGDFRYEYFVLLNTYTYPIVIGKGQTCGFAFTTSLGDFNDAEEFYSAACSALGTTDVNTAKVLETEQAWNCLLYTSPSPRD